MDELRAALELATHEELQELTRLLFSPGFNPLDYVALPRPIDVEGRSREVWITALEERFRFLAADGVTVIQGKAHQVTYRQVLERICRHLRLAHPAGLSTTDLEGEVFLHLLSRTWKRLPQDDKAVLTRRLATPNASPLALQSSPLGMVVSGSSALITDVLVRPLVLRQIAAEFALYWASRQATQAALAQGSLLAENYLALQAAQEGMALTAARYSLAQGVFAVLGPMLWSWFLLDLGWRAVATNYARVIPAVFALAQIRLMN